ncbi:MAG: hypothetical protein HY555_01765 [Euryarchaeota archaeon]|nr:hypothetical protein [Euryarchaeota archaeon]
MENSKKLNCLLAVIVILVVALVFLWYQQSMKKSWNGDYHVIVYGHCTTQDGKTYPVSAEKFIEVWDDKIIEVDGVGPVISSTIIDTYGKATVVLSIRGGGQETSFLTFSRATDGDYYYVADSWKNTAGCHGIGIGDQINKYPSIQNTELIK